MEEFFFYPLFCVHRLISKLLDETRKSSRLQIHLAFMCNIDSSFVNMSHNDIDKIQLQENEERERARGESKPRTYLDTIFIAYHTSFTSFQFRFQLDYYSFMSNLFCVPKAVFSNFSFFLISIYRCSNPLHAN